MQLATQQGQVEKKIQALTVEVKKHDDAIKELQKKFKEAETLLSTAIFQAKLKTIVLFGAGYRRRNMSCQYGRKPDDRYQLGGRNITRFIKKEGDSKLFLAKN